MLSFILFSVKKASSHTFWNGGNGESDGDLEVVDGALDPGAAVGGVVEVSDVDGPDSNADESDDLGELLTELVKLLLEGGSDLLGLSHLVPDLTDGSGAAGADDDAPGLAGSHVGTGEDDVLLVLVDGPGVGDGVAVLDDGHRLSGEDGLVDAEGGGVDLHETEVGGDFVSDGHLEDVAGNNVHSLDLLDTILVGSDNFTSLGLVLF